MGRLDEGGSGSAVPGSWRGKIVGRSHATVEEIRGTSLALVDAVCRSIERVFPADREVAEAVAALNFFNGCIGSNKSSIERRPFRSKIPRNLPKSNQSLSWDPSTRNQSLTYLSSQASISS